MGVFYAPYKRGNIQNWLGVRLRAACPSYFYEPAIYHMFTDMDDLTISEKEA